MWKIIFTRYPIWFFDATGSIIKNVSGQKLPFFYSIVCYDPQTHSIIPLSEFTTTCQTITSICQNLLFVKDTLVKNSCKIAPIIVMDFSWALINSSLRIFNACNLIQYLNWTFELLTSDKKMKQIPTRVYLCATHFIKLISSKATELKLEKKVKRVYLFTFALLQNAKTLKSFEVYFVNALILFNSKRLTKLCVNAFNSIKNDLILNGLDRSVDIPFDDDDITHNNKIVNSEQDSEFLFDDSTESIKKDSPYTSHFRKIVSNANNLIESNSDSSIENEFYNPILFEIIMERIHLVPLWSGIIISEWLDKNPKQKKFTHLTNNIVENYFGYLKKCIIKGVKVMPSELCGPLYDRLQVKYFKYYEDFDNLHESQENTKSIKEQWKDKKDKNLRKTKGYYYKNVTDFSRFADDYIKENCEKSKHPYFDSTFSAGKYLEDRIVREIVSHKALIYPRKNIWL